jgi:hypothetical protein
VSNHILGFRLQNDPVPNLNLYRLSTIQTRRINLNCLPGKKPADRQRLKSSLAKPFLLTIDGNAVLIGKVVKRSK